MEQPSINYNTNLIPINQPKVAALVARVSTARQEEQETIDPQIDEIKEKIRADGNILPPENIFQDDGWTGEMLQRPGLDAMRDAAQEGRFEVLYVYDRGRISRVFAYQEIVIEELENKGIEFVTLHDVKAGTPEERVLQAMQGVFHEYERVKITERMRRGKLFKSRNGILINGHSLYGWDYIKKVETAAETKVPAHYEINEEQARVVRMVFDWVGKKGVSTREVIKRLYDLGIPPRKGKTTFWTHGPIVRLLRCESYVSGIVYYNKSEAVVAKKPLKNIKYKKIKRNSRGMRPREEWIPFNVPKIIEDQFLFDKVQKILEYNQNFACKKRKYDYLLSGFAYCECGNKRVGDGVDKDNYYYRCAERLYTYPLEKKCHSKGTNAAVLDQVFWRELLKFINNPSQIEQAAEKWLKDSVNNDVDKLEREQLVEFIAKVEDEEQRYAKAYGIGALEFEKFRDLMRDTKRKKEGYQQQLDALTGKIANQGIDNIHLEEIVEEAKKVFQAQNQDNKKQIVRDIITKVIVKGGLEVEVRGRIPLFASNMGYELKSRNSWIAECGKVYAI